MKKLLLLILVLSAISILAYGHYFGDTPDVEIMNRFEDKIIYTTDISVDQKPLMEHCRKEGGEFNSCGSICSNDAEACAAVCAFTCEL